MKNVDFGLPTVSIAAPARRRGTTLFSSAAVLSALVHASFVIWLALDLPSQPGLAGLQLDAIGVEIVDGAALESSSSLGAQTLPPPISAPVAEGNADVSDAQQESVRSADTVPIIAAPRPPATVSGKLEIEAENIDAEVPHVAQEPQPLAELTKPAVHSEPPREPVTEQVQDTAPQVEQQPEVAGGAMSSATDASAASTAAAGASPGQLSLFAMQVRTALGKSRPKYVGRGHVTIMIVLSTDGQLVSADVVASSADAQLEAAALAAMRSTSFPRPPEGSTESQRRFNVPFTFK